VREKIERCIGLNKFVSAQAWLVSIADYPNICFNYAKEEPVWNRLIKQTYDGVNVRGAYVHLLGVPTKEHLRDSSKLALKLLKEFSQKYGDRFKDLSCHQFVKLFEKYTSAHWMLNETYNKFIESLSTLFPIFTPRELASIATSLSEAGLRQSDIMAEVVKGIEKKNQDEHGRLKAPFQRLVVPVMKAYVDLSLEDEPDSQFQRLVSDEFVKANCIGDSTFVEQVTRQYAPHSAVLNIILKGQLDKKDPKFKELVRFRH